MWLDPHRPRPFAFVSHGHADHFARHQRVLCSPGTGHILVKRYGIKASTIEALDWGEQRIINDHHITLYPAGHITGSAMIRIEGPDQSILYTGDFKTRSSHTAEIADFPKSDILIMETTFGRPQFVFPPTDEIEKDISRFARETLDDGETPVFLAYSLGKAQEALAILTNAGIETVVHKTVFEMTQACRDINVDLPKPVLLEKIIPPGVAIIVPPNAVRARVIRSHKKRRTAMLSGWALTPGSQYRYQVDQVFPLSDHADYPGLLESVEKVSPSLVYTLHGSTREFARDLRARASKHGRFMVTTNSSSSNLRLLKFRPKKSFHGLPPIFVNSANSSNRSPLPPLDLRKYNFSRYFSKIAPTKNYRLLLVGSADLVSLISAMS